MPINPQGGSDGWIPVGNAFNGAAPADGWIPVGDGGGDPNADGWIPVPAAASPNTAPTFGAPGSASAGSSNPFVRGLSDRPAPRPDPYAAFWDQFPASRLTSVAWAPPRFPDASGQYPLPAPPSRDIALPTTGVLGGLAKLGTAAAATPATWTGILGGLDSRPANKSWSLLGSLDDLAWSPTPGAIPAGRMAQPPPDNFPGIANGRVGAFASAMPAPAVAPLTGAPAPLHELPTDSDDMSTGPFAFLTDVPHEIYQQTARTLQAISDNLNPIGRGNAGVVGGILNTGRGLVALASLPIAPFVGAYKSMVGHPLASAEHAIGTVINPTVAAQDDPKRMYEQAKADAEASLAAMGARPGAGVAGVVPPWIRTPEVIAPVNGGSSSDAAFGRGPAALPPPDATARLDGRGIWDSPPTARGRALERLFGHNLHPNYPTVDTWESDSGAVTSLKSIDLDLPSYFPAQN